MNKKEKDIIPEAEAVDNVNEAEETTEEVTEENIEQTDSSSEDKKKIEALEKELADEKDKYLRLIAEYDNYRKRSINDKMNAVIDASVKTIIEILGVVDNFERALSAECSDANYKKGTEMIFNQYMEVLKKLGVTEIEAQGKPFDPNFHNAINFIEDENFAENTVAQVFQKGYMLGEKVVRCAMVVVANP